MSSWLAATPRESLTFSNNASGCLQVIARQIERARVPIHTPDTIMRRATFCSQAESKGDRVHLAKRGQRLVRLAQQQQDVTMVVERVDPPARIVVTQELETLLVVVVRFFGCILVTRDVPRVEVGERRASQRAAVLQVPGQHRHVLFLAAQCLLLCQPIGDRAMVNAARRRSGELSDPLAFQVVLEDVLFFAAEGGVPAR